MSARVRRLVTCLGIGCLVLGCPQGEVAGTYEAELLVEALRRPIEGTLVLGAPGFDLGAAEAPFVVGSPGDEGGVDEGIPEANSCLIVPPVDEGEPRFVMLFEARIGSQGASVPFGLFQAGDQRIDVVELTPLGTTLGGRVVFRDESSEEEGRLYADRTGDADGTLCMRSLESWKAVLDAELARRQAEAAETAAPESR